MLLLCCRRDDREQSANIHPKGRHETNSRQSGDLNVEGSQLLTHSVTLSKAHKLSRARFSPAQKKIRQKLKNVSQILIKI